MKLLNLNLLTTTSFTAIVMVVTNTHVLNEFLNTILLIGSIILVVVKIYQALRGKERVK